MIRRALTCLVTATALAAGGLTAFAGTAAASPAPPPGSTAPPRDDDALAAHAAARASGRAVEVVSATTETRRRWANPDGSLTDELHAAPVRVRRGDGWVPIDTTLTVRDGRVRTAATIGDVSFSAGGTGTLAEMAEGDVAYALEAPGRLPAPVVDGAEATYVDALPGIDIVLTARASGFEQSFVIKSKAAARGVFRLARSTRGLSPRSRDGALAYVDANGTERAWVGTALMWDAAGREAPVHVADVAHGSGRALQVTPDAAFLADPAVKYPVTVDPPIEFRRWSDAYVNSAATGTNYGGNAYLKIGLRGTAQYQTYISFDVAELRGKHILDSTTFLGNVDSVTCSARTTTVYKVNSSWTPTGITWANRPATDATTAGTLATATSAAGGAVGSTCEANNWMSFRDARLTSAYQGWADGANYGMSIRTSATDTAAAKDFASGENTSWTPRVKITYNSYPFNFGSLAVENAGGYSSATSTYYVPTSTPTLFATVFDYDGDTTRPDFELWDQNMTQRLAASALPLSSTTGPHYWTVPFPLADGAYKARYRAYDGIDYAKTWSDWIGVAVDTVPPPMTVVSSDDYPRGQYAKGPGQPGTFTFARSPDDRTYFYWLNTRGGPYDPKVGGNTEGNTVTVTPPTSGSHVLYVETRDWAGNPSVIAEYAFGVARVPAAPVNVTATAGDGSGTVSWDAPPNENNSAIDHYEVVVVNADGSRQAPRTTADRTMTVPLDYTKTYSFAVRAHTSAGYGPEATSNSITVGARPPDAPTAVTAWAMDGAAEVSWTPGAAYNSPITSYTVYAYLAETGQRVRETTATASPATVGGLINGLEYYFTVTATNAGGVSAESARSNTVRPMGALVSPGNVHAEPGDSQATVSWDQPVFHAGVTNYEVRTYAAPYRPGEPRTPLQTTTFPATVAGGRMTRVVGNLVNGQRVYFTVTARTLGVATPESEPSNEVTPAGRPFAPGNVTATPGDTTAQVSWTAPAARGAVPGDNGSAITSYTAVASPGGQTATVSGSERTATVPGLRNGTAYTFTVYATNAIGDGEHSEPSAAVVPFGKPFPPTRPTVALAGAGAVRVEWTPPTDRADGTPGDNGSPITRYTVHASPPSADGPVTATGTEATVTGLTPGVTYTFTVTATNARGTGDPSPASPEIMAQGAPAAPTDVQVRTTDNERPIVSWTAPDAYGATIAEYEVEASNGTTMTVPGEHTSTTFTRVAPGESVTFRVRARNEHGYGPYSARSAAASWRTTPLPPRNVAVTETTGQRAVLTWEEAIARGTAVSGYRVVVTNIHTNERVLYQYGPAARESREDRAFPLADHYFQVIAESEVGDSAPAAPDQPAKLGLPTYKGLGDSYSSGEGVPPFDEETDNGENSCRRSEHAYPRVVASRHEVLQLTFVACSGAKVEDLYAAQHPGESPRGQLAALDEETNVVSLTLGGNDAGFGDMVNDCVKPGQENLCNNTAEADRRINETRDKLRTALRDIKTAAPTAHVVLGAYPLFVQHPDEGEGCVNFSDDTERWIHDMIVKYNDMAEEVAGERGVVFAGAIEDAFDGHEACTLDAWSWDVMYPTHFSFHPMRRGQEEMANVLAPMLSPILPVVTSVAPASGTDGDSACVETVTVRGRNFAEDTQVLFGSVPGEVTFHSREHLSVVVPKQAAGTVPVYVRTDRGRYWGQAQGSDYTYVHDTRPPVTEVTLSRTPTEHGWVNGDQTVTLTATDPTCPGDVASISYFAEGSNGGENIAPTTVAGDSVTFTVRAEGETTVTYHATDSSSNAEVARTVVIRIDKQAPTGIAVATDRGPDSNGYYNRAFTATWSGDDSRSGIASCTTRRYEGPDTSDGVISGSCTDRAGNTGASVALRFKYDATAPTGMRGTPSRPADANGWYNEPVTIAFSASDPVSGIESCTSQQYSGPDTTTANVSGVCRDRAGNVAAADYGPFKFDDTDPTAAIDGAASRIVTTSDNLTGDAADNLSGVGQVRVRFVGLTGEETRTAVCTSGCGTVNVKWRVGLNGLLPGQYTVFAHTVDVAGNVGPDSAPVTITVTA